MFCQNVQLNPENALSIECFPCNALYFYFLTLNFADRYPYPIDKLATVGELVDSELPEKPKRGALTAAYKRVGDWLGMTPDAVKVDYGRYRKKKMKGNK